MLEGLYWTRNSQTNTADSYRDYLSRYADGPHAAEATEEIAFQDARQRRDPALLDTFLGNYPSGRHTKEVQRLRDDIAWERTDKTNKGSLTAYLKDFPEGHYTTEARAQIENLTPKPAPPPQQPPPQAPQAPPVDDNKAIDVVLDHYKKAYEDLNIDELTAVWPGAQQRFNDMKSATLSLKVLGMDIQGDSATVNVSQSFKFRDLGGTDHKFDMRLAMRLRRAGDKNSSTGGWIIDSVGKK
jgi:hypothetical protein